MTAELALRVLNSDAAMSAAECLLLMGVAYESDADGICRRLPLEKIAGRAEVSIEQAATMIRDLEKRGLITTVAEGLKIVLPD